LSYDNNIKGKITIVSYSKFDHWLGPDAGIRHSACTWS